MDFINKPIGWLLKFCSGLVGNNYIFAILLLAVLFEIVLLPFAIKQQKNSIKQARLRPKEMAIRKKYAGRDDKPTQQKMSQEIQELYQKEGYNPLSGCLPLLIQFPLLIALYNVVIDPLKYICGFSAELISKISALAGVEAARGGTMALLSKIKAMGYETFRTLEGEGFTEEIFNTMPDLTVFGLDLSTTPMSCMNAESIATITGWLVLSVPIITFIAYFFSMKMSRKLSYQPTTDNQAQMGCSNKVMDIMMPLFSVFISFGVPAALGVYWIFKSLLGVVKQVILYYAMPLPKFTDEDYKAAEKEIGTRSEKNTTVKKSGRVVRSLHHIDDEDFEDTAEAARLHKEALARQEEEDRKAAESSRKKGLMSGATLKKDDKDEKNDADENKAESGEDSVGH